MTNRISLYVDQIEILTRCGAAFNLTGHLRSNHVTDASVCAALPNQTRCRVTDANEEGRKCLIPQVELAPDGETRFSLSIEVECKLSGDTYHTTLDVVAHSDSGCTDKRTVALEVRC